MCWQCSMVFYWHNTHLLRLSHALWSLGAAKIGEAATKRVNQHIYKTRRVEEEIACPYDHCNEVEVWMYQSLLGYVEGCEPCGWKTSRKSYHLRGGSLEAHRDPRIPRRESIQTAFLPNLWTVQLSVPFWHEFGPILTSLCGDKDFFLRGWVTRLGYVHSSSSSWQQQPWWQQQPSTLLLCWLALVDTWTKKHIPSKFKCI